MKGKDIFEKNREYNVNIEGIGIVSCVWDGDDFYLNENINCNCKEGLYISGVCIGDNLVNKYKILAVLEI